ncbi:hypothetical protein K1719_020344 [Acacia pycnantha]|nr:hypothetical protein K1719_020344 [Acacia pycnantha]
MVGDAAVELENCRQPTKCVPFWSSLLLAWLFNVRMEPKQLDPKHSAELLKHLDKQNEFLQDSYKLMFNELQKLQVEEEMLMRKLYEAMSPYGLAKKADNTEIANGDDTVDKHVENEQKGAGEIANGDDMVDKHQENGQNRTIKIADGDDAMDKNAENEQNRTRKIVNGDDTDNKPLENERNGAIRIANGDDTDNKPVENVQNSIRVAAACSYGHPLLLHLSTTFIQVMQRNYQVLLVSQFTLYGFLKGNKPDFHVAMPPQKAKPFYASLVDRFRNAYNNDAIKGKFYILSMIMMIHGLGSGHIL